VSFSHDYTQDKGGGQGNKTKKTSLVIQIQSLKKNGTCSLSLLSTLVLVCVCVTGPPSHSVKVQTNYFFLSFFPSSFFVLFVVVSDEFIDPGLCVHAQ
jgi:hypothetical protein